MCEKTLSEAMKEDPHIHCSIPSPTRYCLRNNLRTHVTLRAPVVQNDPLQLMPVAPHWQSLRHDMPLLPDPYHYQP